jgi:prepilin-type N-terminal cleavage/methylation domain-containing protein
MTTGINTMGAPMVTLRAKRMERVQLAGAFIVLGTVLKREQAPRTPNASRYCGAFSLIEVVCAIVILGIALAGMTEGIATALSSNKESEAQTTAALMAQGQIETLRAEGDLTDGEKEGDGDQGLSLYHWKQTISPTRIDGLHEVQVVVENSRTGKAIYELQTLLFQPPEPKEEKKPKARGSKQPGRQQ